MEHGMPHQEQNIITRITRATTADANLLSKIGGRSLLESHGRSAPASVMLSYRDENFSRDALEGELADPVNVFHIISYNGKAAGYSKMVFRQPVAGVLKQDLTKLERLYLLSEYHDLKLGQRLLQFNIDLSKDQGEEGMWLYVWKGNERAIRFYEKAGFQTIGEGKFRLTENHANEAWQMLLEY